MNRYGPSSFALDPAFARPDELRVKLTSDKPEYRPLESVVFRVTITNIGIRSVKTRFPHSYFGTTSVDTRRLTDDEPADVPKAEVSLGRGGGIRSTTLRPGESTSTEFTNSLGEYPALDNACAPGRYAARAIYLTGNAGFLMNDPPAVSVYSDVVEYRIRPHTTAEQTEYDEFIEARGDNLPGTVSRAADIQRMEKYLKMHPKSFYRLDGLNRLIALYFREKRYDDELAIYRKLRDDPLPSETIDRLWYAEAEAYSEREEFQRDYARAYRVLARANRPALNAFKEVFEQNHGPFPPEPVVQNSSSNSVSPSPSTIASEPSNGRGMLLVLCIIACVALLVWNRNRQLRRPRP